MPRSLIVMPDDTAKPILDAIETAKKSLRVKMFLFSDPGLLQALIAAHQRGVNVRVMLNPKRRDGEGENEVTRKALSNSGIEVADSNPAFDVTHEKSMVVDDATAFIKSLNWEPKNLTETRDYAVVTDDAGEVAEAVECFDADWDRKEFGMDGGYTHEDSGVRHGLPCRPGVERPQEPRRSPRADRCEPRDSKPVQVMERQRVEQDVGFGPAPGLAHQLLLHGDVRVRDDGAFRFAGRAARVELQRGVVVARIGRHAGPVSGKERGRRHHVVFAGEKCDPIGERG